MRCAYSSYGWSYQQQFHSLKVFDTVTLENPLHFPAQAPRLDKCLGS